MCIHICRYICGTWQRHTLVKLTCCSRRSKRTSKLWSRALAVITSARGLYTKALLIGPSCIGDISCLSFYFPLIAFPTYSLPAGLTCAGPLEFLPVLSTYFFPFPFKWFFPYTILSHCVYILLLPSIFLGSRRAQMRLSRQRVRRVCVLSELSSFERE